MTAFCLSKLGANPPNRDPKEDIFCQEGYREVLWDTTDNFSKPEFLFYFKDLYSDGTVYYRFLIGCYTDSGIVEAKGQFLKTFPLSDFTSPFYVYAPRSQLIVTKDWSLVHRYFSWVFRNHQYENSKFIYFLEGSPNLIPENEEFKDIDSIRDSRLSDFPANYRNNPLEYLNSDNAYELSPYKIFDYSYIATRTK